MPYATNATIDLSRMRRLTNTDAVWYVEPVINHQSWFDPPITKAHTYSSGFVSCILDKWPRAWECQRFYFCIRCMTYGWLPPLASWQTDTGVEVTGCIFVQNPFWSTVYEHSTVWVVFGEAKELFFFVMTWVGRSIIARTREAPQWLSQLCGGAGPSLFDESAQRRNSNFSLNWFDVFKLWFHFLDGCRNMLRQRWKMTEESFCSSWSSQSCKKWFQ